jgi:cytochrome c biogenesis protein
MSVSTHGIRLRHTSAAFSRAVELLSSMRFSIALLTIICIASVIGTVLKQNEPAINAINQFGPFWAAVFQAMQLTTVYSAWWFLLILAFLVLSTSLCIARNTPKILSEWKVLKEDLRVQALGAFKHRASGEVQADAQAHAQAIGQALAKSGWRVKLQERNGEKERGYMVAAKKGSANKFGYIAAHSAIVLVCIGGLLDGDLFTRTQEWFNGKQIYAGGGLIKDIPAQHRLAPSNPAYRANLLVSEGTASSTAVLNRPGGVLIQDLPFSIELKKFIVEYYSTGMPKLFASDIVIHDKETGEKKSARVEVNSPAFHRGVAIYQSSFDDGGSAVKLRAMPMREATKPFTVEGSIGGSTQLARGASAQDTLGLEFAALRVINVENLGGSTAQLPGGAGTGTDVRAVDLHAGSGALAGLEKRLGAGNKTVTQKQLRNIGPSITYRLRDAAGQAREFHNYQFAADLGDGVPVFLMGVRETAQEQFRYLRAPADEKGEITGFARLRAALLDENLRELAVQRYAAAAVEPGRKELAEQLAASTRRALELFVGPAYSAAPSATATAGLTAVAEFLEKSVPADQREKASEVIVRLINGVLFELNQLARVKDGAKPLEQTDETRAFMTQAVLALSDAALYPAPMAFQLTDFTQVQASVFQVAKAPGQPVVYLGCLLLILGVFAMLYVRERRLWVWVTPKTDGTEGNAEVRMALSSNRQTLDIDREFDRLKQQFLPGSAA